MIYRGCLKRQLHWDRVYHAHVIFVSRLEVSNKSESSPLDTVHWSNIWMVINATIKILFKSKHMVQYIKLKTHVLRLNIQAWLLIYIDVHYRDTNVKISALESSNFQEFLLSLKKPHNGNDLKILFLYQELWPRLVVESLDNACLYWIQLDKCFLY